MIQLGNLDEKFEKITEYWDPHIIAELNGQHVKIAKVKGEFSWHHHVDEDEMFYIFRGSLTIQTKEGDKKLNEGDFIVIPKGVEHRPVALEECWIVLFEPAETLNTGNEENELTRKELKKI